MYCLHTVWLNASEVRRLDSFYIKCLRKVLGIPLSFVSRVSNKTALEAAGKTALSATLRDRQNSLMDKIARLPDNNVIKRSVLLESSFEMAHANADGHGIAGHNKSTNNV